MKPALPIKLELSGTETARQLLGKWARAQAGKPMLEGDAYYYCWDCRHKGPAVNVAGRSSEEARKDPALNAEMKRLWNSQAAAPPADKE
jgi:hypothetical protein